MYRPKHAQKKIREYEPWFWTKFFLIMMTFMLVFLVLGYQWAVS